MTRTTAEADKIEQHESKTKHKNKLYEKLWAGLKQSSFIKKKNHGSSLVTAFTTAIEAPYSLLPATVASFNKGLNQTFAPLNALMRKYCRPKASFKPYMLVAVSNIIFLIYLGMKYSLNYEIILLLSYSSAILLYEMQQLGLGKELC